MSEALLREVLADKEAFLRAEEEAGLIATKVFSDTFVETKKNQYPTTWQPSEPKKEDAAKTTSPAS